MPNDFEEIDRTGLTQKQQDAIDFAERAKLMAQSRSEETGKTQEVSGKLSFISRFFTVTPKVAKPNANQPDAVITTNGMLRDAQTRAYKAEQRASLLEKQLTETKASLNAKTQINKQLMTALEVERAKVRELRGLNETAQDKFVIVDAVKNTSRRLPTIDSDVQNDQPNDGLQIEYD